MSLRGRFSHGCHRLYNQQAMRLFSFVLGHRRMRASGRSRSGFRRTFYSQGEVFEMRLPSRGFYYELDPPLPVEVLEGRIKGTLHQTDRRVRPQAGRQVRFVRHPDGSIHRKSRRRRRAVKRGRLVFRSIWTPWRIAGAHGGRLRAGVAPTEAPGPRAASARVGVAALDAGRPDRRPTIGSPRRRPPGRALG